MMHHRTAHNMPFGELCRQRTVVRRWAETERTGASLNIIFIKIMSDKITMSERLTVSIYYDHGAGTELPSLKSYLKCAPHSELKWGNIDFVLNDPNVPCDVFVVLNNNMKEVSVECGSEIWTILQEPPTRMNSWMFHGHDNFNRVFGPIALKNTQHTTYYPTHSALPWFINRTYDELIDLPIPQKDKNLSWVTSNKGFYPGHLDRMKFLRALRARELEFDLFGTGFNFIQDKFDALAPYKYSLAIENYSGKYYWTEKLSDCFLTYTMPIYYGCTNISDYFPLGSYIHLDIKERGILDHLKDIINSDTYQDSYNAISSARDLVLNNYHLFPFVANAIKELNITPQETNKKVLKPYTETIPAAIRRRIISTTTKINHLLV
jgi:hypothetical protein